MRRFRHLTGQHRTPSINQLLGGLLAFNAGAINAGGFLVVGMYTSHMTGFASMLADNLILGNVGLLLGALGTLLAFVAGAAAVARSRPAAGFWLVGRHAEPSNTVCRALDGVGAGLHHGPAKRRR
jgi:uncharacterized membrane protein YoaK (UPF0700 family)